MGKKSACQVRQDQLSNPPNYFIFHFILVHLFYGHTKRLCPDAIVGLGARLAFPLSGKSNYIVEEFSAERQRAIT